MPDPTPDFSENPDPSDAETPRPAWSFNVPGTEFRPTGNLGADHWGQAFRYAVGLDDPSAITDPRMHTTVSLLKGPQEYPLALGPLAVAKQPGPDNDAVTALSPLTVTGHRHGIGELASDLTGKLWGLPNTLFGLGIAGIGYGAGLLAGTHPHFQFGNNAIQMLGNPLTLEKGGTVTMGNVQIYGNDLKPTDYGRAYVPGLPDIPVGQHEEGHTRQSERLGPLYFPLWLWGGGESARNPLEREADYYGASQASAAKP